MMAPTATRALWCFTFLALLSACGSEQDPARPTTAGLPGALSKMPSTNRASDADVGLDPGSEGWGTEVIGSHAKEQVEQLLHFGAHPKATQIAALTTEDVTVSPLRPLPLITIREGADFHVLRAAQPKGASSGAEALSDALEALYEPFESEPEIHVKVWRVDTDPAGAITTLFYQAFGRSEGRPYQQNGTWECSLGPNNRRISGLRTLQHEEVLGPAGVATLFTECTSGVFAGEEEVVRQLVPSLSQLSSTMEITVGPQIAAYEGICIGDANSDGLDDVYLSQTRGMPNRLLLQRPDGTIDDASHAAGVDILDRTHASLFLDLDADGDQDLVVAGVGIMFFQNKGNDDNAPSELPVPRFELIQSIDMTDCFSISAADADLDGDLDLYICRYRATSDSFPTPYHDAQNGRPNVFLRNDSDWSFVDATEEFGLDENNNRFSFASSWTDIDSDGDPDLYVANDFGRNNLYRNDGGHFKDAAAALGVEDISAGMSADWGDPDSDGDYDVYVGNMFSAAGNRIAYQRKFQEQADEEARDAYKRHARGNSLFLNQGQEGFLDVSVSAAVTMGRWAWGSRFVDLNNDCREDLVVSNGYITSPDSTHDL